MSNANMAGGGFGQPATERQSAPDDGPLVGSDGEGYSIDVDGENLTYENMLAIFKEHVPGIPLMSGILSVDADRGEASVLMSPAPVVCAGPREAMSVVGLQFALSIMEWAGEHLSTTDRIELTKAVRIIEKVARRVDRKYAQ